ncbi:hypothetical protein JXM83_00005 [Candidatus Woesearchaeota archaeon]|nr:hypothetical protein [Candidatus Woesearchaeota archaeon]
MKKKGQFYLIAVVILIAIFLGVLIVNNSIKKSENPSIYDLEKEIKIEKGKVLDYIANNNLDSTNSLIVMTNFSNIYLDKIGDNKNSVFIIGDPSYIRLIGNVYSGFINYSFGNAKGGYMDGTFEEDFIPEADEILIDINGHNFSYNINSGQNIYYTIEHIYNDEVYIIR